MKKYCSIKNCSGKTKAKGLCDKHLARVYRNGSPLTIQRERLGLSKSPEYNSWRAMKERCNNPKHNEYRNYGMRGIKICQRWSKFSLFLSDMGKRPTEHHTLDRINSNGNYEPRNCRWLLRKEQMNNTRINKLVNYRGETKTISEWADYFGIKYGTLWARLNTYEWSIHKSLKTK